MHVMFSTFNKYNILKKYYIIVTLKTHVYIIIIIVYI